MLLGREAEQEALALVLSDARAGKSRVLALVGEAGIGKSSLLDAAAELAQGMRVLRARGVQSEVQIPFAGLFELLRPTLGHLDRIPAPQAEALERALALRPGRPEDRFAVGAATLSLLAAAAEADPLAVLVDDAQWLDGASADAVLFALRRILADRIAAILTVRSGEPSLLDGSDLQTLAIEGLDPAAAAALIRDRAPNADESAALRLHRATGGNPLAILELAREQLDPAPLDTPLPVRTSVADAYLHRSEVLPEPTREALVLAAATDRGELTLFARAAESLGISVADLGPAEEAGLVTLAHDTVEFRHPLARSATYAAASAESRRRSHRALAGALPDADIDRRAWHLAIAALGPEPSASSALEQAGARALERSAYDAASRAFERAAELAPSDERTANLFLAASDAAWYDGKLDRAAALLEPVMRFEADDAIAVEVAHRRGQVALRRGPIGEAREILLAGIDRAAPERASVLLAEAVYGAFFSTDGAWITECLERARGLSLRAEDPHTAFYTSITKGVAGVYLGDGDAGAGAIRAAVELQQHTDELRDDPRAILWAAMAAVWLREESLGHEVVDRALAATRARAAVGALPYLLVHVAIEQASTDRWVEAQAAFSETIALSRETGQRVVLCSALARAAHLQARLGQAEDCRRNVEEALVLSRELGATAVEFWGLAALAELELVLGDTSAALARFDELAARLDRYQIADVDLSPAPEQIELRLRIGKVDEATAAAAAYQQAADAKGQPWARARAARSRGLLADDDVFAESFEAALDLHGATLDEFETARTELAYGGRLRRAGKRTAAREHLRAALATFDGLGAAPWSEQARVELAATGETARRRDPSSLDQLTPQELQVSLLLAEGKTTREAAAALFLSPKTIEYHLRNTYRKLGIHSRDELRETLYTTRDLAEARPAPGTRSPANTN
jgi:DNA-binding CsgD family transcriptional regulator